MRSRSSTAAPVVLIVASPKVRSEAASCTIWAAWPSVSMSRLPGSRTTICAFALVREERPQRLADLARVVVQQEVVPRLVADHPVFGRDLVHAGERLRRGLGADGLALGRGIALGGAEEDLRRHALHDVPGWGQHEVVGELQGGERGDDAEDVVTARLLDLGLDGLPLRDGLRGEEVGELLALAQGDEGDHGLAAEQVLVGEAVLVDVLVLVEVAVLAGGELELGDAEAERDRDQQADDRHDARVLAEVQAEPGPVLLHADPPSDLWCRRTLAMRRRARLSDDR